MYIIGLTGGIASGKSAVSYTLKKMGAEVLDIDEATHKLLEPSGELYKIYLRHFGEKILMENGELDRKIIGKIIFDDLEQRQWINSVAHPLLLNVARDFLVENLAAEKKLVVLEIPLLFEAGWESLVDEVWAVFVKRKIQIMRLMKRDNIDREQAIAKINSQMPPQEICRRADVVIKNSKLRSNIYGQVLSALRGRFISPIKNNS